MGMCMPVCVCVCMCVYVCVCEGVGVTEAEEQECQRGPERELLKRGGWALRTKPIYDVSVCV